MKKIFVIIFISLVLITFNKVIFSKIIILSLEKWVEKKVSIKKIDIDYFKNTIILNSLKIKNIDTFHYDNIFEADKVIIQYNLRSLFTDFVKIEYLSFLESKFFLEFKKKDNENIIIDDNIEILKKLKKNYTPKIYPSKEEDKNFIIQKIEINNSRVFLKVLSETKEIQINLSDMVLHKVSNKKGFQHYKSILEIILRDIFLRIPDQNLRDLIKRNYKL
tara:strand:- start:306 stop:962 length:657 start_codon:yes stop_codon:yes gene_type:complete